MQDKIVLPPAIIKYMGSKRELIEFVVDGIRSVYDDELICDLFSGTGVVGAVLKNDASIWVNDIQHYSNILARAYLGPIDVEETKTLLNEVINLASDHALKIQGYYPDKIINFSKDFKLNEFIKHEKQQQSLLKSSFDNLDFYLFSKYYSGTYWSFEQCTWIDGLRKAANTFEKHNLYPTILSSIMHAMAYNAQSTGHYAQYRDATNEDNMRDILKYRSKDILPFFKKKYIELIKNYSPSDFEHNFTALDYEECLKQLPENTLVYADPPYTFVHYSRFYHALETLVLYDYPKVQFKGRYRSDRHQSPFCQSTKVKNAFSTMFRLIFEKRSKLVLSYSDNGMISMDDIKGLVVKEMPGYNFEVITQSYLHSTMGRLKNRNIEINETLLVIKT
jgi:adenine-specific DNA-methyltransferase